MQDVIPENKLARLPVEVAGKRQWLPGKWLWGALVFGVSLAFLWLRRDPTAFNFYDEGVIAYGAQRILQGDLPYRDFWVLYPPGQLLAIAALFKLFGSSLAVERAWDIALRAAIVLLGYLITARLAPRRYALLTAVMSVVWLQGIRFYGYPLIPALLLTLASVWFFIGFLHNQSVIRNLFMTGLFTGLLVAFRHDIAFYVFIAEGLAVFGVHFIERDAVRSNANRPSNLLHMGIALGAGVAVGALPLVLYLAAEAPAADVFDQLIVFLATVYPAVRSLPYPTIFSGSPETIFPFYFHFVILAIAVLFLVGAQHSMPPEKYAQVRKVVLFLALLVGLMFLKSLVRPQLAHLIHVMILSFLLGAVVWSALPRGWLFHAFGAVLAIAFLAMLAAPIYTAQTELKWQEGLRANSTALSRSANFPRAGGLLVLPDQAAALDYVRAHVPPGEKIFVGNGRHDVVLLNDVLFYFLAERDSATRYHELHPGQVTTASVQRVIIDDLESKNVRVVVLFLGTDRVREPNESARSSHVTLLDDYLKKQYRVAGQAGNYRWLEKLD